jgi:hypothetical protein
MALYEQFCDHANDLTSEGKQRIVEFIFSEPQDWNTESSGETEQLENILHELRIVDPACGSGAFLVGMKQVLTELYRKLGTTPDYHLKEQIINENLYGVDIKDWAIRVAEFRLWLSLVEAEEQLPDQRPVLPNFSFKLKVGDSLIQKLDGEFVSLDTLTRTLDGGTSDFLTDLQKLKREHFEGEANQVAEIEQKQVELLKNHIDGLIENLSKDGSQQTLLGDKKDKRVDDNIEQRIKELEDTRDAIDEAGDAGFFMWDIDFSDVMVEGGFDIVIGNPPYVRQEDIIDQGIHPERLEEMDDSKVSELKKQYKKDLVGYTEETFDIKPYKRSDIYVYFYFKGIDLLRENGTLCYITSNSWLDIGYGKRLHEMLLKETDLSYIIGNTADKSFEDADVNAYITVANRRNEGVLADETCFMRCSRSYFDYDYATEFADPLIDSKSNSSSIGLGDENLEITEDDTIRSVSISHESLWRLGGGSTKSIGEEDNEPNRVYSEKMGISGAQAEINSYGGTAAKLPTGSYDGGTWGRFVDAPTLYFELWRDAGDQFKRLGDIATVDYGLKSGANKFFFVPKPGEETGTFHADVEEDTGKLELTHSGTDRKFKIEPEFWMRPIDEIPERYYGQFCYTYTSSEGEKLVPNLVLVKNREVETSPIKPQHLSRVHIDIDVPRPKLKNKDVFSYIEFGEEPRWGRTNRPLSERSSLSNRSPGWYAQPNIEEPYILLTRYINANFHYHYNPCAFPVADNFYYLSPTDEYNPSYIAGYLNSTIGWLLEEVSARTWTNALKFDRSEYANLPILSLSEEDQEQVDEALQELMARNLGNVFEELGAYSPDDISPEVIDPDRYELDKIFFQSLGFTSTQIQRLHEQIVILVRDRLMRQPDENPSLCETIAEHNPQSDYSR